MSMQATPPVEEQIWEGGPSQWLNFKTYLMSWVGFLVILAVSVMAWGPLDTQQPSLKPYALGLFAALVLILGIVTLKRYLDISYTRYVVTTERIRVTRGILSKRTDDTELYRVDDTFLERPMLQRLVALGNVVLVTSDRSTPRMVLQAVPKAGPLRDQIRRCVEAYRDRKRTRVIDFEQ